MEEERKEVIAYTDLSGSHMSPTCKSNNKEIILSTTPGRSDIEVVKPEYSN